MTKKKIEKPQREVTKRQLSRWQQQRRRQRITFGVGIFIIAAVLVLLGSGWYFSQYRPLQQIVIRVNDTEFDMNYYIKMLKFNYMHGFTIDVVTFIEQNELMRQGAMELGIIVSDSEVDEELKSRDPPLSKDYRDLVRSQVLTSKLLNEYFDKKVPVSVEQRHVMAMFLESESQATEVRARIEKGEDFTELAGELSLEFFSKTQNGDLGWLPKDVLADLLATSVPVEYIFSSEVGVLSQPIYDESIIKGVGYWLIEVLEKDDEAEQAHVRAILLGSEAEAQQVKSRIEAGEEFATLAKELSQLGGAEEDEGDLGWLDPGMMTPAFDEFVFNPELELETLSEPIRDETAITNGGYWLVKVLDKDDNRRIEDEDRDLLKAKALDEWISTLWDDPENEIDHSYLDDEKKMWAMERAAREL